MKYSVHLKKLSEREKRVWQIISWRYGNENAITSTEIQNQTGIDRFQLAAIIQSLRLVHNVPVASKKHGKNKGYFLPAKSTEIDLTVADLESQASKLLDVATVLWKARKELPEA
ncbi:hypothetical protein [Paenibacillus chitinolyticus]|uniref:hypothetical protein n=1 Tax=Paenibacillus chitinolyticus TaxID=79263 RepID=UPI003D060824